MCAPMAYNDFLSCNGGRIKHKATTYLNSNTFFSNVLQKAESMTLECSQTQVY